MGRGGEDLQFWSLNLHYIKKLQFTGGNSAISVDYEMFHLPSSQLLVQDHFHLHWVWTYADKFS